MKESVKNRIDIIKKSSSASDLVSVLCPFYERGNCPDCITCKKDEATLEKCKDAFLEHVVDHLDMETWAPEFENPIIKDRKKVIIEDVVGIGVNCNTCYMYDKCPMYQVGYACAIDWGSSKPSTPNDFMDFLIDVQYERVRRSSVFEKVDGGVPDAGLSGEIDRLHNLINSKISNGRDRLSISVEATGGASASAGGGILSKIFGGNNALPESKPETIEIEAETVEPIALPAKKSPILRKKQE